MSLRHRLLAPVLILRVLDFAATWWAARSAAQHAERRIEAQLQAVARTLTEPPAFPLTKPVLQKMKGLSGAEFLYLNAKTPRISTFPDSVRLDINDLVFDSSVSPPPAEGEPESFPDLGLPVTVGDEQYRRLRLFLRNEPNLGGTLIIFYPESLRLTAVRDAVLPVWFGGIGGVVAVGLVILVGRRLTNRIRELDQRTRAIAAGDFRPMTLPTQDDELLDLCRSVNDMAVRLAEYRESHQQTERLRVLAQFAGGLAHQLRNAAAGARLAVQLHLGDCPSSDRESLDVALRQLARIEANLRQFLLLGRPPDLRKSPCDIGELLTRTVELVGPRCRHEAMKLTWTRPTERVEIQADASLLDHLFLNVMENALDAAGPGGSVDIRLIAPSAAESGITVEVIDSGPGPSTEVESRLFEAFVTGKDQGIGLGLAVAKQAADAHGGRITWERREGTTVFRVALPRE